MKCCMVMLKKIVKTICSCSAYKKRYNQLANCLGLVFKRMEREQLVIFQKALEREKQHVNCRRIPKGKRSIRRNFPKRRPTNASCKKGSRTYLYGCANPSCARARP